MKVGITILSIFLVSECYAYTPWIVDFVRRLVNPPPAPRAEEKYCTDVKRLSPDLARLSFDALERKCSRQGVYATAYLDTLRALSGEGDNSCTTLARRLQLLQDAVVEKGIKCNSGAEAASAAAGVAAAHRTIGQTSAMGNAAAMREAEVPILEEGAKELDAIGENAQKIAIDAKQQADHAWEKILNAQKDQNGFASGGLPCLQERSYMENRTRTLYATLSHISIDALKAKSEALVGASKHRDTIRSIQGFEGKIEVIQKKFK